MEGKSDRERGGGGGGERTQAVILFQIVLSFSINGDIYYSN